MSTLTRHRPTPLSDLLGWFDEATAGLATGGGFYVRVEDYIDGDTYVLRAEMPGIDPDKDVKIEVDGNLLTISGERREEERHRNRSELHYGSFARTVALPQKVRAEDVTATYHDGVLELRAPYEGEPQVVRQVPVQRTDA
jgi:HSP20 family molecular chaperone IbpA